MATSDNNIETKIDASGRILNLDEVIGQEDWKAIMSITSAIYACHGYDLDVSKLPTGQRIAMVVDELESEVNNGGFNQYFFNSAGNHAQECLGALRVIGAERAAALLADAIAVFPENVAPADRDLRQKLMAELDGEDGDAWEAFDSVYYDEVGEISSYVAGYIRQHPEEI